jgi:putative tryptophan/tyrosine transport system substrate-binding protein
MATRAAKTATTTIPIVFMAGGDPIALGYVASLARPGGNVTGVSYLPGWDFFATHLERLMAAVPGVTRVALPLSAGDAYNAVRITPVERTARAMGVHLHGPE